MGFKKDAWATCWGVEPKSDTLTQVRISTSKKDRDTNEYVQDFSGFISFVGTSNANRAAKLKERDRIKLGDVDVTTSYNKEKKVTYTTFKCFNFSNRDELENESQNSNSYSEPENTIDGDVSEEKLPF